MNILIIYTGGTIGMVHDQSGMLKPFDFAQILENVPELQRLDHRLTIHSFKPLIDSSDMKPEIWLELAQLIQKNYDSYDGFVVLHGTDTMAYTASALSFLLENLSKPVIITGSQLPIGQIRTDAKENLITAIEIAATQQKGKALVPEVCIYFDYSLLRGNRSTKAHATKFGAFQSPNCSPLAEAGVHLRFDTALLLPAAKNNLVCHTQMDTAVASIKLFPGIQAHAVNAILEDKNTKAIILEAFGSGNTHTAPWFIAALKKAIDAGKIVVAITQCIGGSVELGRYATSSHLVELGVVAGYDLTFEAALTKLMFLLGKGLSNEQIKIQMSTSLCGELSRN